MASVTDTQGKQIDFDPKILLMLADHAPSGTAVTCLYGFGKGMVQTDEAVDDLLARLGLKATFARLTRGDDTPIWVRGPAVTIVQSVTAPDYNGSYDENIHKSVLSVGSLKQAVREAVAVAVEKLNACGASL